MRALIRFLAAAAIVGLQAVQAQELTLRSPEIRGRVVDDKGAPVEGAVVVARWNLLFYRPKLEGSGWYPNGDALHIAEGVSDRDGRYTIAAWGPKARAAARLEEGAPSILAFKSGYEPAAGRDPNIALRRAAPGDPSHAERIKSFQEGPLAWQFPGENWKSMPRMVAALQAEKARAPDNAKPVLGANTLPGRSGAGHVLDAKTGEPLRNGTYTIGWSLRRIDGAPGTRRFVNARRLGTDQPGVEFYVSPFRLPGPKLPDGWEIDPNVEPDINVYVLGYRAQRVQRWSGAGGTIRLERLPEGREGAIQYVRAIRADLDRELAGPDRESALDGERVLLIDFMYECGKLTPDVRQGLCYDPQSDIARYAERARMNPVMLVERFDQVQEVKVVAAPTAGAQASAAAPVRGFYLYQRIPVSGFSIEPGK